LSDKILHRRRAACIFLEVDPGFLAQDQIEQRFENAPPPWQSPTVPPELLMNRAYLTSDGLAARKCGE